MRLFWWLMDPVVQICVNDPVIGGFTILLVLSVFRLLIAEALAPFHLERFAD